MTAQAWQYESGGFGTPTGGAGTYDVSGFGGNARAFMDYLDSFERAVDLGSATTGIANERYARKMKT